MNSFKKLSLPLLLALAVAQPALARGKHGPKGPEAESFGDGEGPGHALREALKSLDLSEEQKTKLKDLRKSATEAHKEVRTALKDGRKAMEDLMKSDAKKEEILSKFEALQTLRNKMARARFEMMLAIRDILTPEQRQKFRGFMESHRGHRFEKDKEQD